MVSSAISVVIPSHGRPEALTRLLDGLGETARHGSLLVVDDGTPGDAYDHVAARFPEVRWDRGVRTGPAGARNRGWRQADGDVVVFLDDDVVIDDHSLRRLVHELGDRDAIGARIEPLRPGRLVADFMHAEHLVAHKVEDGQVRWLVTACVAIRRSVLEDLGGFDEHLTRPGGEDADLSLRLRSGGYRLAVSDDVVAFHDHRAGLVQLARTYYRHGTGQRRLAAVHTERRTDLGRSTRSRLSPADWWATYRRYRRHHNVPVSLAFIGLRFVMMVPWLIGAARG